MVGGSHENGAIVAARSHFDNEQCRRYFGNSMLRPALVAFFLLLSAAHAEAQQIIYIWSGPSLASTSGTVLPGAAVSGSLVLQGPVENLPLAEVTPVSFSFSAGPVTIDDGTPLHAFTTIQVQTDANGEIIDAVIQFVEEGDASAMGGGLFAADVICVGSCDGNYLPMMPKGDVATFRDFATSTPHLRTSDCNSKIC
jgi:hypothetical protein